MDVHTPSKSLKEQDLSNVSLIATPADWRTLQCLHQAGFINSYAKLLSYRLLNRHFTFGGILSSACLLLGTLLFSMGGILLFAQHWLGQPFLYQSLSVVLLNTLALWPQDIGNQQPIIKRFMHTLTLMLCISFLVYCFVLSSIQLNETQNIVLATLLILPWLLDNHKKGINKILPIGIILLSMLGGIYATS